MKGSIVPFSTTLLVLLLALPSLSRASDGDTAARPLRYDPAYIVDYKQLLTTRIYFLVQDTRLVIDEEPARMVFKPNAPFKFGIAAFYKWFGLGLSVYSPLNFTDGRTKGTTDAIDLRMNLYSNVFALEGHLQKIQGFYIANFPGPDGTKYTNNSLTMLSGGMKAYYIYNYRKFSFRSAYFQNEWQKKSAGSFLGKLAVFVTGLDADSVVIPADFIRDEGFDSLTNFRKATMISVSLSPGYAYNLVFLKRCYIHAGMFVGPQYNVLADHSSDAAINYDVFSMLISLRGAIGYNGPRFHAGFSAVLNGFQPLASKPFNFYMDPPQYRLWVGTRFDVFKKRNKKK